MLAITFGEYFVINKKERTVTPFTLHVLDGRRATCRNARRVEKVSHEDVMQLLYDHDVWQGFFAQLS
jgi:hypothetical protein